MCDIRVEPSSALDVCLDAKLIPLFEHYCELYSRSLCALTILVFSFDNEVFVLVYVYGDVPCKR